MSTVLHLDTSPRQGRSQSRRLSAYFVEQWGKLYPQDTVIYRDLRVFTPPHISEDWIAAAFAPLELRSGQMQQALQLSDLLIDEFLAADVFVFGVPMWNFSVPAVFKDYIDNVVRVGRTFLIVPGAYGSTIQPLVSGKKMFILVSSGTEGYSPAGPMWPLNYIEPYLRAIFGFIGVTDMTFIYSGGDSVNEELRERSITQAMGEISTLIAPAPTEA